MLHISVLSFTVPSELKASMNAVFSLNVDCLLPSDEMTDETTCI